MMDLAMNFDADECLVTAMFDKGNRNDTVEAIDHIIPFLKGDADMIGLVCNTIRKLFCMSDEGYEVFLMDLEEYKMELEEEDEERIQVTVQYIRLKIPQSTGMSVSVLTRN